MLQKFEPCSKADLFDVEYWSLEQGSSVVVMRVVGGQAETNDVLNG